MAATLTHPALTSLERNIPALATEMTGITRTAIPDTHPTQDMAAIDIRITGIMVGHTAAAINPMAITIMATITIIANNPIVTRRKIMDIMAMGAATMIGMMMANDHQIGGIGRATATLLNLAYGKGINALINGTVPLRIVMKEIITLGVGIMIMR